MYKENYSVCFEFLRAHCNQGRDALPDATIHYANLLWYFSEMVQARTIYEIGMGPEQVSGATFIHSLANRQGGKLVSFDIEQRKMDVLVKRAEEMNTVWDTVIGDSLSDDIIVPTQLCDILYIDGDHDFNHAYGDFKKFWPCLRTGGYCLIDDFGAFPGVNEAVGKLTEEGFYSLWILHDAGNGRSVIRKN